MQRYRNSRYAIQWYSLYLRVALRKLSLRIVKLSLYGLYVFNVFKPWTVLTLHILIKLNWFYIFRARSRDWRIWSGFKPGIENWSGFLSLMQILSIYSSFQHYTLIPLLSQPFNLVLSCKCTKCEECFMRSFCKSVCLSVCPSVRRPSSR